MRKVSQSGVNLKRAKGNEEPKSKYYIVPEGDKTEIQYFCGIRDNSSELNIKSLIEIILIENDESEAGQSHPKRKITNFNKELKSGKFTYVKGFDKVIFVVDRDPQNFSLKQLDDFIDKCNENQYEVCLSNPTFEFFLLLHDSRVFTLDKKEMLENRRQTRGGKRFLEKKLFDYFDCNKTKLDFDKFKPNIKLAIENEKKFCEELNELKNNLGSNVGVFIDNMIDK